MIKKLLLIMALSLTVTSNQALAARIPIYDDKTKIKVVDVDNKEEAEKEVAKLKYKRLVKYTSKKIKVAEHIPHFTLRYTANKGDKFSIADIHSELPGAKVTYSTSNERIATVTNKGLVTAKKNGKCVLEWKAVKDDIIYLLRIKLTVTKTSEPGFNKRFSSSECQTNDKIKVHAGKEYSYYGDKEINELVEVYDKTITGSSIYGVRLYNTGISDKGNYRIKATIYDTDEKVERTINFGISK